MTTSHPTSTPPDDALAVKLGAALPAPVTRYPRSSRGMALRVAVRQHERRPVPIGRAACAKVRGLDPPFVDDHHRLGVGHRTRSVAPVAGDPT